MKVLRQTPDELILQQQPVKQVITGLILILITPIILYFLGRSSTFSCKRLEPSGRVRCEVAESLLGITLSREMVEGVQSATLETGGSNGVIVYRVVLVSKNARVAITSTLSSSAAEKKAIVAQVNDFLLGKDGRDRLEIIQSASWLLWLFSILIFLGLGLVLVAMSRTYTLGLDRRRDLLIMEQHGLIGASSIHHALSDVAAARIEEDTGSRVVLDLLSGDALPLSWSLTSGKQNKLVTVEQINDFLQVAAPPPKP